MAPTMKENQKRARRSSPWIVLSLFILTIKNPYDPNGLVLVQFGRTDGRPHPLVEMQGRIEKKVGGMVAFASIDPTIPTNKSEGIPGREARVKDVHRETM